MRGLMNMALSFFTVNCFALDVISHASQFQKRRGKIISITISTKRKCVGTIDVLQKKVRLEFEQGIRHNKKYIEIDFNKKQWESSFLSFILVKRLDS